MLLQVVSTAAQQGLHDELAHLLALVSNEAVSSR
jgi:hypothetical protein